jgi:heme oxygenase
MGGTTRRDRLRRVTAAAHLALEAVVEASGAFDSLASYARHLRALLPLHATLEAALDAAGAELLLPDWPRRRKAELIEADLRRLGVAPPAGDTAPVPRIEGHGAALGALYVLEGQTLGGAVLARRAAALGLTRLSGAAFLDAYGTERGAMWRGFLAALETAPLAPGEEAAMEDAAAATFAAFAARLGGATR